MPKLRENRLRTGGNPSDTFAAGPYNRGVADLIGCRARGHPSSSPHAELWNRPCFPLPARPVGRGLGCAVRGPLERSSNAPNVGAWSRSCHPKAGSRKPAPPTFRRTATRRPPRVSSRPPMWEANRRARPRWPFHPPRWPGESGFCWEPARPPHWWSRSASARFSSGGTDPSLSRAAWLKNRPSNPPASNRHDPKSNRNPWHPNSIPAGCPTAPCSSSVFVRRSLPVSRTGTGWSASSMGNGGRRSVQSWRACG